MLLYTMYYITECQRYNMPTLHQTAIKLLEMRFSVLHLNSLHDICVRPDISATFSHTFATIEDSVVVFLP